MARSHDARMDPPGYPRVAVSARASGVYIVEADVLDGRIAVEVRVCGRGASQLLARAVADDEEGARRCLEEQLAETEEGRAATPLPGSVPAHPVRRAH